MIIELNDKLFDNMLEEARKSQRKRSHYNLHKTLEDQVQRLCIALLKGTYIRPHSHGKEELLLPLRGEIMLVIFSENGSIEKKIILSNESAAAGVEIGVGVLHSFVPLTESAMAIEVKRGPYEPAVPEDFAVWAPQEGADSVTEFQQWLDHANVGEKYGVSNE